MGCAISTVKYLLFIFNFFLTLCGILLIIIGILTNSNASNFKELLSGNVSFASMLLIGTGVVIFIIAFFGCCGAIQESHCMMTTYAILLLTLFFIELGIGILAFVYRSNAQEYMATSVDRLFDKYDTNEDSRKAVDAVQHELRCCGTSGPSSWGGSYPSSCCVDSSRSDKTRIASCPSDEMWTVGCIDKLTELSRSMLGRLGWLAIGVGAVEFAGIVFALCLASSIRRSELRGYA